ncbi:hypothetical protein K438DRAFT_2002220 [Mycena galopus ATCC 62051]|nr:hypothetical protein K438DRAFT_2002220 [Mycena galopus ATCC 62051]
MLGIKKVNPKKPAQYTEKDIDHSLYLWPRYLFPVLDDPAEANAVAAAGMVLEGVEHDPRSLVINVKVGHLEIESLLHTSPQIFQNMEFFLVMRVPAKKRGFKVVIALGMVTHTIGWLSQDNLSYVFWLSPSDVALARPCRVPDVVLDYGRWCKFVVSWLQQQDMDPKWDLKSFAYVLSMPGNHPMRGVGRYSEDEIAWRSERYLILDDVLSQSKNLNKLCGKDSDDIDSSHLLITTKESVLRYERWLTVHKQAVVSISERKKRLVLRYNRLSIRSHRKKDLTLMVDAPWTLDLAELAPALLLFGHMGPAIVDNWSELYDREASAAPTITSLMRERKLPKWPSTIPRSKLQELMLKPTTELSLDDINLLKADLGSDVNPVVQYFHQKASHFHQPIRLSSTLTLRGPHPPRSTSPIPSDVDPILDDAQPIQQIFEEELPLLMDSETEEGDSEEDEDEDDEEEVEIEDEDDVEAREIEAEMAAVGNGGDDSDYEEEEGSDGEGLWEDGPLTMIVDNPPNALVFTEVSDHIRQKRTLKALKETMKVYTVGPMDFCGHAKAVRNGNGWVIGLCHWDPTLPPDDQKFMMKSWNAIGTWKKGIRKLSKTMLRKEIAFRNKVRKELKDRWNLKRDMLDADVQREVKIQRKRKREKALKQAKLALKKANKKKKVSKKKSA